MAISNGASEGMVNRNNSSTSGSELVKDAPKGELVHWNGNNISREYPADFKITVYADHGCPFAHRAYIALHELGLPYEDVIVDLSKPREPWYLKINPRGIVPSLHIKYGKIDACLTESAVIARFLANTFPSHLMPTAGTAEAGLVRARQEFFVDTWVNKVQDRGMTMMKLQTEEQKDALVEEIVNTIKTEIEPMLEDAAPFFGGSKEPTIVEVLVGVFVLRAHAYSRNGLTKASIHEKYSSCPTYWKWAEQVMKIPSFHVTWDEQTALPTVRKRMGEHRARVQKEMQAEREKMMGIKQQA